LTLEALRYVRLTTIAITAIHASRTTTEMGCVMWRGSGRKTNIINVVSVLVPAAVTVVAYGCSASNGSSSGPSAPSGSGQAASAPFAISLPIAPGDSTSIGYGVWPFGVHGSSHAFDGHPGFDFEYRYGAPVLAVIDATVSNRHPDSNSPADREVLQLRYPGAPMDYLVDYTNVMNVPASIQPGSRVTRGQVLGTAGPMGLGSGPVVSGMIHFGVCDPTHVDASAVSAPCSVSPDSVMTPEARAQFDTIWASSAYIAEWWEPFTSNSRARGFPFSRTWTLQSGQSPAQISVTCPFDGCAAQYSMIDASGATIETGTMTLGWASRPTTVDFVPSSGPTRLGLYDVVGGTMRLALGAPGAGRPASFASASTYTTR
jgi:hypothetical protein